MNGKQFHPRGTIKNRPGNAISIIVSGLLLFRLLSIRLSCNYEIHKVRHRNANRPMGLIDHLLQEPIETFFRISLIDVS